MRIAVLSDIHGNLPALEAVLAALEPYDAVWQLGDVVGYGPQPNEVVARLIDEQAVGVRGNHDAAAVGELETDAFNDEARAAIEWTAEELDAQAREWLARLPAQFIEAPFTLVHGSPRDPVWEYVFTSGVARRNFPALDTPHGMVGHTHIPAVFRERAAGIEGITPGAAPLDLGPARVIVNPGSVGQPRDGDPRASAMLYDPDEGRLEWHRVDYPIQRVQRLMAERDLPSRLAARLSFGL